jgi:hypothetical protein
LFLARLRRVRAVVAPAPRDDLPRSRIGGTMADSCMDPDRRAAERARLEGYIADSLRLRRGLSRALAPVALVALVVAFFARTPGLIALVIVVSSIGVGLYITTSHIAEWRSRIAELDDSGPRRATRPRQRVAR